MVLLVVIIYPTKNPLYILSDQQFKQDSLFHERGRHFTKLWFVEISKHALKIFQLLILTQYFAENSKWL